MSGRKAWISILRAVYYTLAPTDQRASVTTAAPPSRQAIRAWFDRTYRDQGLAYLRPPEFYSIFMGYLDVGPGHRLLDVGCGPGLLLGQAVERGADAWGVDVSATALALARRLAPRARVCAGNAEALGFADRVFDRVTCIGTFEHFPDGGRALAELRRVLKPDGRLCVMVPNSRTLKWQLESRLGVHDPDSHERAATLEHWREVFLGSRFTIDRVHRDEWPRWRRRRLLSRGGSGFVAAAQRARHLAPLCFANQFVFLLRP
jgi:SAM-dependent methyltransferase